MTAAPELPMAMPRPRPRPRLETWLVTDSRGRRRYWIEAAGAEQAARYLEPGDRLIPPGTPAIARARSESDARARAGLGDRE